MNAPDPRVAIDVDVHKTRRTGRLLLPILTLVLAGAAFALWKNANKPHPAHSPLDPRAATLAVPVDKPMLPTKVVAQKVLPQALPQPAETGLTQDTTAVTTGGLPAAALGATSNPTSSARGMTTPTEMPANGGSFLTVILERLTKIDSAIESLRAEVARLSANASATTAASSTPAKLGGDNADAPVAHRAVHRRPRRMAPKAELDKNVASSTGASNQIGPDVLSVDTWNGRTSVAVRSGGEVSFISEGDRAGNFELKRADKESQRAFFVDAAGKLVIKDRDARQ